MSNSCESPANRRIVQEGDLASDPVHRSALGPGVVHKYQGVVVTTTIQIPTRRFLFATAVAVALALGPLAAVFAGPSVDRVTHTVAQDECQNSEETDSYSLQSFPIRCLTSATSSPKQRLLSQVLMGVVGAITAAGTTELPS